ncbi:MarR family winged helix-turn-helix transcriptional regulator [Microbacterium sp. ASV49]|uniref:MarR family transcriptional regulator n=1 Tax=Microbacterium candidum TaxID=3041922 RepID=A0ABT7MW79_9MICO|nr:MarR family transcriptional regulator [Microbacterium sp. ASV49]MDL9978712.1 MarR family transcriptional regulator [Microbacterium sp. ASV49]
MARMQDAVARQGSAEAAERKSEIISLLLDAADASRTIVSAALLEYGVPASVGDALRMIATATAPLTPREIAARLGRDPSTLSLTTDKLVEAGLVERSSHPTDGRKRTLMLTDNGAELWHTLTERVHASGMLNGLDPDEQAVLLVHLRRLRLR